LRKQSNMRKNPAIKLVGQSILSQLLQLVDKKFSGILQVQVICATFRKKINGFFLSVAPPGTNITLTTEEKYFFDFYKRQLAYVVLPEGSCLNEIIIKEGYAKAMGEYYCLNLAKYEHFSLNPSHI